MRIIQLLIGVAFAVAGLTKVFMTKAMIAAAVPPYITSYPPTVVRLFGIGELFGGLLLLATAILNSRPRAAMAAALGLAAIMGVAIATHIGRGDTENIPADALLFVACALVAWNRRAGA